MSCRQNGRWRRSIDWGQHHESPGRTVPAAPAAITFDMDADSLIHISRPADGWRTGSTRSPWAATGRAVAIPRILETYRRLGLKQSFFIPGWCLETYPGMPSRRFSRPMATRSAMPRLAPRGPPDNADAGRSTPKTWFGKAMDAFDQRICRGDRRSGYRASGLSTFTQTVIDTCLIAERGFVLRFLADGRRRSPTGWMTNGRRAWYEVPVHWGVG